MWAYKHIFGFEDEIFKITPMAIDINDTRALHVAQLTRDALRNMNRPLAAADVLILGASYREDVGDTRYSGSELIVRKLTEMGQNPGFTILMSSTGGNSRNRIPTRDQDIAGHGFFATRKN